MRKAIAVCAASLFLAFFASPALAQVSYTTQHNDNMRTGANLNETVLNQSNVNVNTFGKLFKVSVDDQVYSTPLYVPNLTVNGGTHNVLFVTTVNNTVYAFDADAGGAALWTRNFGTPTNHTQVGVGGFCAGGYNDFTGNIGIVGTPVIDESTDTMYFVTHTVPGGTHTQTLHAINILTGADRSPNGSVVISGGGFNAKTNNQRPALTLANGLIYIAWSSFCDVTPYNGIVMAYAASTLAQQATFNDTRTGSQGGIWQAGQGLNVDSNGNLYVMTGNGSWDGSANFGESFLKLNPTNLSVEDYFTPSDFATLNNNDADLGSAGGLLIPGTNLIVGGGKSAIFYLLNTNNMGHETGNNAGAVQRFQAGFIGGGCSTGHIHGGPVYYNSSSQGPLIYVWSENDFMHEFKFNGSTFPSTSPFASSSMHDAECGMPGVMMSVSANGNNDSTAIVWGNGVLSGDANHGTVSGILRAFNAINVNQELWDSQQNASRDSCNNFSKDSYPVIANGKVYLASFGTAGAGSGQVCAYGLLSTSCSVPTTPGTLTATAVSSSQINLSWGASTASCTVTYNIYRSTTSGFTPSSSNQIASGVTSTSFSNTGLVASTTYFYVVEGVDTTGSSGPSNQASATTSAGGGGGGTCTSICIDSGSTTAVSPFVADADFSGGATINHANTINTSNVTNPAPQAVYQTARVTTTAGSGSFTYTIPGLTAGTNYLVRLHFAETFWTTAGSRKFNVSINGTQVLTNFDIFATAGGQNIANVQEFTMPANSSGQLVITFTSVTDKALISGIEIDTTTPPPPTCTSICIDSGSTAAVGSFVADADFTGGATITHANTINTSNVTNPAPAAVYQTARVTATAGAGTTFSYTIPGLAAGSNHTVRLHFCETFWTTAGSRKFNVSINGTQVLTNFDIFATAGGQNIANIQQFTATADASGNITLTFTSVTDKALISGIEIN
jgi:Malectin domain